MKRFLLYCSIFLSVVLSVGVIYPMMTYQEDVPGSEIYRAIKKSKQRTSVRTLIIGDSTANQFFNNTNDEDGVYSLACNQAIAVCGHYFLLHNYLTAGNRPEEVYLLYNAISFSNNLNQVFTYHYFLKPFFRDEYKPLMSSTVMRQIRKIPDYERCQLPPILTSAWAPDFPPEPSDCTFLSPISREYLCKMDSLSKEYGFRLYIVPTLMDETKRPEVDGIDPAEYRGAPYAKKLDLYRDHIVFLEDSCFADGTHIKNAPEHKPLVIENMEAIKQQYLAEGICH